MERLTLNVGISNGNTCIKCSIGKSIFAVNLEFKFFFRATFANDDSGSLKFLHAFL